MQILVGWCANCERQVQINKRGACCICISASLDGIHLVEVSNNPEDIIINEVKEVKIESDN
jgi:hypothetical protein